MLATLTVLVFIEHPELYSVLGTRLFRVCMFILLSVLYYPSASDKSPYTVVRQFRLTKCL